MGQQDDIEYEDDDFEEDEIECDFEVEVEDSEYQNPFTVKKDMRDFRFW